MPTRSTCCARLIACAFAVLLITACSDRQDPSIISGTGHSGIPLRPHYVVLGADSTLPVNHIRITARNKDTGEVIGTFYQTVDPNAAEWNIKVELPTGGQDLNVEFLIELVNEAPDGTKSVEWSGNIVARVSPSQSSTVADVPIYRGPPENLTITAVTITEPLPGLEEDATATLHAATAGNTTAQIYWSSLDPAVASITVGGVLTAHLPGNARIIAVAGPRSDTAVVTVTQKLTALVLTPGTATLDAFGSEFTYAAKGVDKRGGEVLNTSIGWAVSDSGVAALVGVGKFRARRNGRATISIFARNQPSVTAIGTMIVAQRVKKIETEPDDVSFDVIGAKKTLTAAAQDANDNVVADAAFKWSSSNSAVATVDASGTVTAAGAGSAVIRVATVAVPSAPGADSVSAAIPVSVKQKESAVEVTPGYLAFTALGDTARVRAVIEDANGNEIPQTTVVWTSANPAVASVDASGLVTAVSKGSALITAATATLRASASVQVSQQVASVLIEPHDTTLKTLTPIQFYATPRDRNGNSIPDVAVEWSSSDTTIARVDGNGLVTPGRNGTVSIEAEAEEVDAYVSVTFAAPITQTFVIVSGNNQRGQPQSTLPQALVVRLADGSGRGIAGRNVAWNVTAGSGNLITTVATTDTGGYARNWWTLGPMQGTQTVTALLSDSTLHLPPLQFNATSDVLPTATITWAGIRSTSWGDTANWTPHRLPVGTDTIYIPGNTPYASFFSGQFQAAAIIVESSASLQVTGLLGVTAGAFGQFLPNQTAEMFVGSGVGGEAFLAGSFPRLGISGPARLVGPMSTPILAVDAPLTLAGNLINTGVLSVGSGSLIMSHSLDAINVTGGASFDQASSGSIFTGGVMRVGGDFYAPCGAAFVSTGTKVVLNGTGDQLITLTSDCNYSNRFADLEINKTSGAVRVDWGDVPTTSVRILSPTVFGPTNSWCALTATGDISSVTGSHIGCAVSVGSAAGTSLIQGTVGSNVNVFGSNAIVASALTYPGDLGILGTAHTDGPVTVGGRLSLGNWSYPSASLTLGGATSAHHVEVNYGSTLLLNGQTLDVHGNMLVDRGSTFTMQNDADQLTIMGDSLSDGDLVIGGADPGSDFTGLLTAGAIHLMGSLSTNCRTSIGFRSDGTTIVLKGHTAQSIDLSCTSPTQYLADVDIINGANITVLGTVPINGDLNQLGLLTVATASTLDVAGSAHLASGSTTYNNGTFRVDLARFSKDTLATYSGNPPVDRNPPRGLTWQGSVSSDWTSAGNWYPARVPARTDTVYVPVTTLPPMYLGYDSIAGLVVKPGASLTLGTGASLFVKGTVDLQSDPTGMGTVSGSGTLHTVGSGSLRGNIPANLSIDGNTTAAGPVSVGGSAGVNPGGAFNLAGFTWDIAGALTVGGTLDMTTSGGLTMAHGPINLQYAQVKSGELVAGANFSGTCSIGSPLVIDQTLVTFLKGSHILHWACDSSNPLRDVYLADSASVNTNTHVYMGGLSLGAGAGFLAADSLLVVGGNVTIPANAVLNAKYLEIGGAAGTSLILGSFTVQQLTLYGSNQSIRGSLPYQMLTVTGPNALFDGPAMLGSLVVKGHNASAFLAGRTSVSASVTVQDTGRLTLNGHYLGSSSGVFTANGGQLVMTSAADSLVSSAIIQFNGGADLGGNLTAGVIKTSSAFNISSCNSFVSSGTKVVLSALSAASVLSTCSSSTGNQFADIVIEKTSGSVFLTGDTWMNGSITVPMGVTLQPGQNLTVGGALTVFGGLSILNSTQIVDVVGPLTFKSASIITNNGVLKTNLSTYIKETGTVYTGNAVVAR